jgi:hypothetical protein
MNSPDEIVRNFIRAHHAWNARANERAKSLCPGSEADNNAYALTEVEYDELVSLFCASSVNRQGIAFGDNPTHDPDKETVESVKRSGSNAVVRTRHIVRHNYVSEHEYHLVQEAGEWRIASVLYLDGCGKYECL